MPLSEKDHISKIEKGENERAAYDAGPSPRGSSGYGQVVSNPGLAAINQEAETGKQGSSSAGSKEKGAASPDAGVPDNELPQIIKENSLQNERGWNGEEERNDTRRQQEITPDAAGRPQEGDRRNTTGPADRTTVSYRSTQHTYRPASSRSARGWSAASSEEENY